MGLFKYMLEHKGAILIVALLFSAQAVFDLLLPTYTAKIVDIGIQQYGFETGFCEKLTTDSYNLIVKSADGNEKDVFVSAYSQNENGLYVYSGSEENKPQIESITQTYLYDQYFSHKAEGDFDSQKAAEIAAKEYEAAGESLLNHQLNYILLMGLIMMLFVFCSVGVHCVMNWFATRTAAQIGRDLRKRLFEKVIRFSDKEINTFSAASLITRGTNDIQLITNVELFLIRLVFSSVTITIGGIVMLIGTNAEMAWIVVVAVLVIFIGIVILFLITWPKFKIMQKLVDRVNLVSREILNGMPVIRAFTREPFEQKRFDAANTELMETQLFTGRAMSLVGPFLILVLNLVGVAIVWFGGQYVDMGTMQTGQMIASITYSMVIIAGFLMLGALFIIIPRAGVASERIDEVLSVNSSITDALHVYDGDLTSEDGAEITFNHVSFAYDETSENVLTDISFIAKPGKTTAIIGSTGCGKSTVLKLIERFYDSTSGQITIDGVDIKEISLHKLHETVGYVPQTAFLFSGTIKDSVIYGNDSANEETIRKALSVAQAKDFVDGLEEGLDYTISAGGTNVSGGQRQRLAIARCLATNARAYLFDDSFSALDYQTDARLRSELSKELSDKTIIIVAQRISTIMHADNIIVLKEGTIVGQGSHAELMKTCPEYQSIALSQLSEEELAGGDF